MALINCKIQDICPRRRVLKEKAGTRPAFSLQPRGQGHIDNMPRTEQRGLSRKMKIDPVSASRGLGDTLSESAQRHRMRNPTAHKEGVYHARVYHARRLSLLRLDGRPFTLHRVEGA